MNNSKIEWTDKTWNPVTGCTKVSQGCKNCYAETFYERFHGKGSFKNVICHEDRLTLPAKWKEPSMVFVNSMSDLFHENVPFDFINKVFAVMALCPQHTFQILTKRAERMAEYFKQLDQKEIDDAAEIIVCEDPHLFHEVEKIPNKVGGGIHITNELLPHLKQASWFWDYTVTEFGSEKALIYENEFPLSNVWLGVSVEDQKAADERIPFLLQVPAAIRFLSCEPLLGEVNLNLSERWCIQTSDAHDCTLKSDLLHWVIVGGESGPKSRPMHPDWARSLRDQCKAAGVAFFFKQWGEYSPAHDLQCTVFRGKKWVTFDPDTSVVRMGKKKAGRMLDGCIHSQYPHDL